MINTERSPAPALDRGIQLLDFLHRKGKSGASAAEIRKALKVPIASVYRILAVLDKRGLICQDDEGGWRLGQRQIVLGFGAHSVSPLVKAARDVLRAVARETHEMSELAVRSGPWDLMMLDTWQTEGTPLRIISRPGLSFELAPTTPHGHCFLAFGVPRLLEEFVRVPGHARYLNQRDFGDLFSDRELWRKLGFAWRRRTGPGDIARIAAPIFEPRKSPRRLLATIGIALDVTRLTQVRASQWGHLLMRSAREVEEGLATSQR